MLGAMFSGMSLLFMLLWLVPAIFYLLMLQKALTRCSPELRAMDPNMVWLMLIPIFGIVWHFIIVNNMAKSLGAEFAKRNIIIEETEPGKKTGMPMCILSACGIIPFIGILAGIAALVFWVMYWIKISEYSEKLA